MSGLPVCRLAGLSLFCLILGAALPGVSGAGAQTMPGEPGLQDDLSASRTFPGPTEGDLLTEPADPDSVPIGPHQKGIVPENGQPAVNAITRTEDTPVIEPEEREGDVGEADIDVLRTTPDPEPVPSLPEPEPTLPAEQFRGPVAGPNAGGVPGRGRMYVEDLKDFTVHLADTENFGRVARLIVNLETGELERLVVSTGGLLGVGDERYDIPWETVAAINTGTRELRVAVSRQQIQGHEEAFGEGE